MALVEFSITPVIGEPMTPFIDAALDVIMNSGLKYEVEAMGTTIEGDIERVLEVVMKAHEAVKSKGASRVMTEIRIDDRVPSVTMEEEVSSYRQSL